ncbi:MAG TPA: PAS domain S-box protein [Bryobacteraceae bacterium]|nr:PAS domain S-box protein [Bryobacteraceae bacterium]
MKDRTQELEVVNEELRRSNRLLAIEVEAAVRLQQIATEFIASPVPEVLYEQILDAAQALLRADFASIQVFHPERGTEGELRLLGHRGFSAEAAKHRKWVSSSARTTCGEALRTGQRVIVPDIRHCDFMAGSEDLNGYLATGILAAQSSPLVSRSAELLGMVTTYWREPHDLSASELRSLDVLARLAADLIGRARSDQALRENQKLLASIDDAVKDVIFYLAVEPESQFRFVSVNAAFLRVTGLNRDQVMGKTVCEVVPEPSLTMVLSKYRQAIEEKTALSWEETSEYPTGQLIGEVHVTPVFDDRGVCTHLAGSVHDITERKRIEEQLRASEARLLDAQRLARVGHWERDIERNHSRWSDELLAIFGLKLLDPAGLPSFASLVHPKDRERISAVEAQLQSSHTPIEVEYRIVRPDGEIRFVRAIAEAVRNDQGKVVRIMGAAQDITDQTRAKELLHESEERLKSAERLAHVGHWEWNIRSNHGVWSDEQYRILGYPPDFPASFDAFWSLLAPADRERLGQGFKQSLLEKRGFSGEVQIVRPDGNPRTLGFVAELILDEEGEPERHIGALQDITEIKAYEAQLLQSQKDLRALTARLVHVQESGMRELARELHDDLSQRLAALGMEISTLALPSADLPPSFHERIRAINERVGKMATGVHSLGMRLHPALLYDLGLEIALKEQSRGFSALTGIAVQFDSPGSRLRLPADVSLCLFRVAQEGFHNIAKHSRATSVRMTLSAGAENCTLRIEDDGRGFELGAEKARTSLGLISMQERARQLDGNFTIHSQPGKGTTLEISVPCRKN